MLDDACDRPDDDWDLEWHEYRTYSPEFFTALEKYEADEKDEISESLKKEIQSTIEEEKLDYENIADLTMNITVRLRNGKKETFYPDSFEDYADYVFNLEMPIDPGVYLHRAGRTGRAEKSGTVISLVDGREADLILKHEKDLKIRILQKTIAGGKISG